MFSYIFLQILKSKDGPSESNDENIDSDGDNLLDDENAVEESVVDIDRPSSVLQSSILNDQDDLRKLRVVSKLRPPTAPIAPTRVAEPIIVNEPPTVTLGEHLIRNPMISVVVRKRPLSALERQRGDRDIVFVNEHGFVDLKDIKIKVDLTKVLQTMRFHFDNAFGEEVSNRLVYQSWLRDSVPALFDDVTVSCFTFGPTGSGKVCYMMP